jgi:riboflavin-specific deaminase-like protein
MPQPSDAAWNLVREAARTADSAARDGRAALALDGRDAVAWRPDCGWQCVLPADDERRDLLDLYLPFCSATAGRPLTLGHLGESLDGFIATHTGDSQWVTGPENVTHMHRLRALCDAIVVGAGTVAADNPRLTTRKVAGPNPLRVVLDPDRRLDESYRVFSDGAAETLYVCARDRATRAGERFGQATVAGVDTTGDGIDLSEVVGLLRARGCVRIFVEGGGITVSMFLQAGLLDRLHLAIAPFLIGDGKTAIRLPAPTALGDCHRPSYRVFRMGGDILFDCDLRSARSDTTADSRTIARII